MGNGPDKLGVVWIPHGDMNKGITLRLSEGVPDGAIGPLYMLCTMNIAHCGLFGSSTLKAVQCTHLLTTYGDTEHDKWQEALQKMSQKYLWDYEITTLWVITERINTEYWKFKDSETTFQFKEISVKSHPKLAALICPI